MDVLSRCSIVSDVESAVADLARQFSGIRLSTLMYFASSAHEPAEVSRLMRDAFPGVKTFGCTSFKEMTAAGVHDGSITAVGFSHGPDEVIAATVTERISTSCCAIENAFARLEAQLGCKLMDLDYTGHFGILLFDHRVPDFDRHIEQIGNLSDITFIGGGAGDDYSFQRIHVYFDGKVCDGEIVLVAVKLNDRIKLVKTQNVQPAGRSFLVTGFDRERRVLLTLDDRPALEVYAEALGLRVDELSDEVFRRFPVGIMFGKQPFVRTIDHATEDGGIRFFFPFTEGMRLELMNQLDIVETTSQALAKAREELGSIRAVIDFDCVNRILILGEAGRQDEYIRLFAGTEMAGFATFGEAYIGLVNQTGVMAVLA